MQVSVTKNKGLERKITVEVPATDLQTREEQKLKELSKKVRMDGFRKGKVPLSVVKKQYAASVRADVISDVIQSTLFKALMQEGVNPAGMPTIEETNYDGESPLIYTAIFEVYPEIKLKPFNKLKVERVTAEVTDVDVDKTLELVRAQQKTWAEVARAAKEGDQVDIDFVGSIDGEEFDGGKAEHFKLELGAKQMIPGFEDGIVGMKAGEEKVIKVKFPKDYRAEKLAGKKADFAIILHTVSESQLPELDDVFVEKMGIKEGGVKKLREEIRKNMTRELEQALKTDTKKTVLNAVFEANKIDLPKALVDQEIEGLKKQAEKMYGEQAKLMHDASASHYEEEATRRVSLGLLISEVIKANEIKVDDAKVREMIESMAEAYQNPQEVIDMYYKHNDSLEQVKALVLEDQVVDFILSEMKVTEKTSTFDEIIKPHQH